MAVAKIVCDMVYVFLSDRKPWLVSIGKIVPATADIMAYISNANDPARVPSSHRSG